MRRFYCAVLLAVLALGGCKGKNDILATYDGGTITRGDLYTWLDSQQIDREPVLKNMQMQKTRLQTIFHMRIAAKEAAEKGFDKSDDFRIISDLAEESYLVAQVLKREIKDRMKFSEPAVKVQQIVVRIKTYGFKDNKRVNLSPGEVDASAREALGKAQEIIAKLDRGESFDELAKTMSDDFSKNRGGDIGYVTRQTVHPEIARVAFALDEGSHSKEPVKIGDSYYIIKNNDVATLTQRNIERVLGNKITANRIRNTLYKKEADTYLNTLMNAPDVERHFENTGSPDKKALLFRVGDASLTLEGLNARIESILGRLPREERKKRELTEPQKRRFAENMFRYALLKRVAEQKGIASSPEYRKELELRHQSILAREYMRSLGKDQVTVAEKDIREEYDKNRDTRYTTGAQPGGRQAKTVIPFAKVHDQIERMMKFRAQSKLLQQWKDERTSAAHFTINESKLEGK